MSTTDQPGSRSLDLLRLMRPEQWTKNAVVLAAFLFAMGDRTQRVPFGLLLPALAAAALFCLASSGIYVFNDIRDADADRLHPVKKSRPLAAGAVSVRAAAVLAFVLLAGSLAGAWFLARPFASVVAGYVALQFLYTMYLKRVALVDILVIATGFVLRALAGGVAIGISISPWLLLCTLLLALFLALCKRRHEKKSMDDDAEGHRPALGDYDPRLLDQLIAIAAGATIVSYSIYTLWPDTVAKFGSPALGFTIPFVIFGVFRYLDLVYRRQQGGRPERVLLSDLPLLVDLALYGLAVLCIFALRKPPV